jgi:prepilin-type N-terminal cleavage/methylation domain-containing protein
MASKAKNSFAVRTVSNHSPNLCGQTGRAIDATSSRGGTVRSVPSAGFTLIELLAVIAVVAILAAILLAAFGGIRTSTASAKTASNLRSLFNATQLWSQDNDGLMPDSAWYQSRSKIRSGDDFERNWSLHPYLEVPRHHVAEQGPTPFTCIASDRIIEGSGGFRRSITINHFTGIREGNLMGVGPVRMMAVENPSRMLLYATGIVVNGGYRSSVHVNLDNEDFLYPYNGKNMVVYLDGSVASLAQEAFEAKMEEDYRESPFWVGTFR